MMDQLNNNCEALAQTLWVLSSSSKEVINMTISDFTNEIYIMASRSSINGIDCNFTFFNDGLVFSRDILYGGSFQALVDFLRTSLKTQDKQPYHCLINSAPSIINTYSQFIGDTIEPYPSVDNRLYDFQTYVEDQELNQII